MRVPQWLRRNKQTGVPIVRLYSKTGQTVVKVPEYDEPFTAGPDGEFDFPEDVSDVLHSFHVGGKPAWESEAERVKRVADEQIERMRDPAVLLAEIQKMSQNQGALAAVLAGALSGDAPAVSASPAPAEPAAAPPTAAKKQTRTRKAATGAPAE